MRFVNSLLAGAVLSTASLSAFPNMFDYPHQVVEHQGCNSAVHRDQDVFEMTHTTANGSSFLMGADMVTHSVFGCTLDYDAGVLDGEKSFAVQMYEEDGQRVYYFMFEKGRVIVLPQSKSFAYAAFQSY